MQKPDTRIQNAELTRRVTPTPMEGSRPQATIGNHITAKVAKNAKTGPESYHKEYPDKPEFRIADAGGINHRLTQMNTDAGSDNSECRNQIPESRTQNGRTQRSSMYEGTMYDGRPR